MQFSSKSKKYCNNLPRKMQDFTASKAYYPKGSLSKRYVADKQKLQSMYANYMGTSPFLIIQTRGCSAIKITKAGKNSFKLILVFELYLPLCIWVNRRRIYALACLTLASYPSATQKAPCCEKYCISPYIIKFFCCCCFAFICFKNKTSQIQGGVLRWLA